MFYKMHSIISAPSVILNVLWFYTSFAFMCQKCMKKTHAELLSRYRSFSFYYFLFMSSIFDDFFSLKLPISASSIPDTDLQACLRPFAAIKCELIKYLSPLFKKLELMVYHVVCSMSWTTPIKAGNLLTISATVFIRTISY